MDFSLIPQGIPLSFKRKLSTDSGNKVVEGICRVGVGTRITASIHTFKAKCAHDRPANSLKALESCLLEMRIERESMMDGAFLHDKERYAFRQRPAFIVGALEEAESA